MLLFQEFYLLIYCALRVRLSFVSDVQHGKPTSMRIKSDLVLQTRMCDFSLRHLVLFNTNRNGSSPTSLGVQLLHFCSESRKVWLGLSPRGQRKLCHCPLLVWEKAASQSKWVKGFYFSWHECAQGPYTSLCNFLFDYALKLQSSCIIFK